MASQLAFFCGEGGSFTFTGLLLELCACGGGQIDGAVDRHAVAAGNRVF